MLLDLKFAVMLCVGFEICCNGLCWISDAAGFQMMGVC
jgi:hypothetical protein